MSHEPVRRWASALLGAGCISFVMLACSGDGSSSSTPYSVCGNGIREGELCDDGNTLNGDGCTETCVLEQGWHCSSNGCEASCGDGFAVGTEVCDRTPVQPGDLYCKNDCSGYSGSCGDGIVQTGSSGRFSSETCDSGGQLDSGCVECKTVFGWVCGGQPTVCAQTGIDPTKPMADLSEGDKLMFCEWLTAVLGGTGEVHVCGSTQFTIYSPEVCVSNLDPSDFGACTVGAVEAYMPTLGSACSALTTPGYC